MRKKEITQVRTKKISQKRLTPEEIIIGLRKFRKDIGPTDSVKIVRQYR